MNDRPYLFHFLMGVLLLLVYSNSFENGWHFDDVSNILDNKLIHSDSNGGRGVIPRVVEAKRFNRPISYLSLALNWWIGKDNVVGYHIINFGIHFINSILVYYLIAWILQAPGVCSFKEGVKHKIAATATILWAIHPIQVQSVTYIVQRMASLSALFYLLALIFYIKYRQEEGNKSILLICSFLLCSVMSVLSKHNGILVFAAVLLYEYIFNYDTFNHNQKRVYNSIALCVVVMGGLGCIAMFYCDYLSFDPRTFSLYERVLTQFRVLVFYLGLLFYPVSDRFSIVHSYELSHGLFDPITTVLSLIFVLCMVFFALRYSRTWRLLSFSILFFIGNHVVESSIIPLEMIFEHRNYLPSVFVFLPCSYLFWAWLDGRNVNSAVSISVLVGVVVAFIGLGTYSRNFDWKSEKTLWLSALPHASDFARVHQNLSVALCKNNEITLTEFYNMNVKTEFMRSDSVFRAAYVSINNQVYALTQKGKYSEAVAVAKRMFEIEGFEYVPKVGYALKFLKLLIKDKDYSTFTFYLNKFKQEGLVGSGLINKTDAEFLYLEGIVCTKECEYERAFNIGKRLLQNSDFEYNALALIAFSSLRLGKLSRAEHFLKLVNAINSRTYVAFVVQHELLKSQKDASGIRAHMLNFLYNNSLSGVMKFEKSHKLELLPVDVNFSIVREITTSDIFNKGVISNYVSNLEK